MKIYTYILLLTLVAGLVRADEYDEAVNLIKDGKYDVATTLLEAHVSKGNETVRAYYALGFCAEKKGDKKRAYDFYRKSIAINRATGNDPENTKRVYERLFELLPAVKPVIEKAWELEALSAKAENKDSREYLQGAARNLHEYALSGVTVNVPDAPPLGEEMTTADMEKALGYKLRLHKVGAKRFEGNGHYYMAFKETVSWQAAKARCQEMGGYLATITSAEENAFVARLENANAWVGGKLTNDSWTWITGEKFSYDNWYPGRPVGAWSFIHLNPGDGKFVNYQEKGSPALPYFICEWNE